ncbi:MAG TPA: S-methyl-5-thioribose-1-phosphate isomerase [Pyrodictiaceae archaeon]|nr:S-methyl-5-thioribose-1-phosphate isomerase [Pyrodictiaceae archaeon]
MVEPKLVIKPIEFDEQRGIVKWLDVRLVPWEEVYRETTDYNRVAKAIKDMEIRGAPAIGVAAAFGMALAALWSKAETVEKLVEELGKAKKVLESTRPTAYNLFWALNRIWKKVEEGVQRKVSVEELRRMVVEEAKKIYLEDIETNRKIGEIGSKLVEDGDTILTHCNAGALATAGFGTALAVIRYAVAEGKKIRVIATETRPLLQGARLTIWELVKEGIDVTLITDNMVGYIMSKGIVSKVIVGADRITRDGYVANKIGTYTIAVVAARHRIPFYVAAPSSTFDLSLEGPSIPIEERDPNEVRTVLGKLTITVPTVKVYNPAFDITPPDLITAIITEKGVITPPYAKNIEKVLRGQG